MRVVQRKLVRRRAQAHAHGLRRANGQAGAVEMGDLEVHGARARSGRVLTPTTPTPMIRTVPEGDDAERDGVRDDERCSRSTCTRELVTFEHEGRGTRCGRRRSRRRPPLPRATWSTFVGPVATEGPGARARRIPATEHHPLAAGEAERAPRSAGHPAQLGAETYWDHRRTRSPKIIQKEPGVLPRDPFVVTGRTSPCSTSSDRNKKKLDYEVELALIGKPGSSSIRRSARSRARLRLHDRERRHRARPPRPHSARRLGSTRSGRGRSLEHPSSTLELDCDAGRRDPRSPESQQLQYQRRGAVNFDRQDDLEHRGRWWFLFSHFYTF